MTESYDALINLLESIEHFLKRLDIYTKIPPSSALDEIVVKILVELLSTLALATNEVKQGRTSQSILAEVLRYLVQHREIREKTHRRWRRGHRGSSTKVGAAHRRRGPDDRGTDSQGCLQSR